MRNLDQTDEQIQNNATGPLKPSKGIDAMLNQSTESNSTGGVNLYKLQSEQARTSTTEGNNVAD